MELISLPAGAFFSLTKSPMKRIFFILACLALMAPLLTADRSAQAEPTDGQALARTPFNPLGFDAGVDDRLTILQRSTQAEVANQVRIERRTVVRITPSSNATRARLIAELPRRQLTTQFQMVEHGNCVPINQIAGVQPLDDDRLLLITRDRQLFSASLERACSAQAFYSGFYIESNDDGQLCVSRDRLHSRAGDSCEVASFNRLVAVRE